MPALGVPIREHWKFPLRIQRLAPDGGPSEDVTGLYLIDGLGSAVGASAAVPPAWIEGVRYFSRLFRWEGRAGLRILGQRARLRAMSLALTGIAADMNARFSTQEAG